MSLFLIALLLGLAAAAEDRSQIAVNCPVGCVCVKNSISCVGGNLTNTDLFLQIRDAFYPDLDTLDISGNRFGDLEAANLFGTNVKHQRLTKLSLTNNKIETIHARAFHAAVAVEELDLSFNEITEIKGDLLGNLPRLRKLSLHHAFHVRYDRQTAHLIHKLLSETASSLSELEELDLSDNMIQYVQADLFCRMPALRILSLRGNFLRTFVVAGAAACLPSLQSLDLADNNLSFLGDNFTTAMDAPTHLRALNLSLNPFDCTCHLAPFVRWFQASEIIVSAERTNCSTATPASLEAQPMSGVPASRLECPDDGSGYLHRVYILVSLAMVGLALLLACLFARQTRALCPAAIHALKVPKASFRVHGGYSQLGKEPEVSAEFV